MTLPFDADRRDALIGALGLVVLLGGCAAPRARAETAAPLGRRQETARIKEMVVQEAANMGVSISLALAVADVESGFDPKAESAKGARGVMQIMPATARGEYAVDADELWDPRINIRIGLHYLGRLIERYDGRVEYALSFYNGGSAVGPPARPRIIPATRSYVRKVTRLRVLYRRALMRGEV